MAQIPAEFSMVDHIKIEGWSAQFSSKLSAKIVLDHAMAEEVIVVSQPISNIPLWTVVPLQNGGVMLSYGHGLGYEQLMHTATDALKVIEMFEVKGLSSYILSPPI